MFKFVWHLTVCFHFLTIRWRQTVFFVLKFFLSSWKVNKKKNVCLNVCLNVCFSHPQISESKGSRIRSKTRPGPTFYFLTFIVRFVMRTLNHISFCREGNPWPLKTFWNPHSNWTKIKAPRWMVKSRLPSFFFLYPKASNFLDTR